jgi:hypothetical protein
MHKTANKAQETMAAAAVSSYPHLSSLPDCYPAYRYVHLSNWHSNTITRTLRLLSWNAAGEGGSQHNILIGTAEGRLLCKTPSTGGRGGKGGRHGLTQLLCIALTITVSPAWRRRPACQSWRRRPACLPCPSRASWRSSG